MRSTLRPGILFAALSICLPLSAIASQCPPAQGVALQVLGSGGPIADDGRASSSYLLWVDGKSRVLIDAGGGAILRFAEARADFRDLAFVGLSHFHADHSADFPALLKSGSFSNRVEPLVVAGPDGSTPFPGLDDFLASLLSKESGAFAYLSGYLDGGGNMQALTTIEVKSNIAGVVTVYGSKNTPMQVDALHVPHGIVPALAFRVRVGDETVVFASDQNGSKAEFVDFARNASLLVMHMPVPENVSGVGRRLHAPPSVLGAIANDANVEMLLVSHFMARSLRDLDQNLKLIQSGFGGPTAVANDLECYRINHLEQ